MLVFVHLQKDSDYLSVKNAFQYLDRFKGMDFLVKYYPTLHLQSLEDTVDDLIVVCKKHGGVLG